VRHSVLVRPEFDPGRFFVDTADEACGHEDEVLIRLALNIHRDELHVVRGLLRDHGRDPDMNHRDADARLREVQRLARDLDGDSQALLERDASPAPELPVVHFEALSVPGHREVPAVRDIHVVG
jgi:hypothetical protein